MLCEESSSGRRTPFSMRGAFLLSTFLIKGGKLARREVKDRLVQEPDGFTGGDGAPLSLGYAVCSLTGRPQRTKAGLLDPLLSSRPSPIISSDGGREALCGGVKGGRAGGRSGVRVLSCTQGSISTSAQHVSPLLGTGYAISKGQVGKQTRGTDLAKATGWSGQTGRSTPAAGVPTWPFP